MNQSQIPDILKPVTSTVMSNVDIYTSVLDPINKSQKRVIFNIEKRGILNSGSRIQMTVHPQALGTSKAFLPSHVGAGAFIDTAILRAGSKILAKTEKFPLHYLISRATQTHSEKQNISMVFDGSADNLGNSPETTQRLGPDASTFKYTNATTAKIADRYRPVLDETDCPVFSLALSDLFPMMKNLLLPVGFMSETVSIELIMTQQTDTSTPTSASLIYKNCCFNATEPTNISTKYGLENCKMFLDYLVYGTEQMNKIEEQVMSSEGIPFVYSDLMVGTTQLQELTPAPADGQISTRDDVREIPSQGNRVNSVLIFETNNLPNPLGGVHRSDAPRVIPEINFRVNDKIIYPRALKNPALMRNQLHKVLGKPISVANAMYSYDTITDFTKADFSGGNDNLVVDSNVSLEGAPSSDLTGNFFVCALDLTKGPGGPGTDIVSKNILYERKSKFCANDVQARQVSFLTNYERSFVLQNGLVLTSV